MMYLIDNKPEKGQSRVTFILVSEVQSISSVKIISLIMYVTFIATQL